MNAITSRLDALRARKKEIEESRKKIKVSPLSGGATEELKDGKPLSRGSLIDQHQEPGARSLPFKEKAPANSNSNSNKPDAGDEPPPISPDELANAKRRIAELTRILNSLDAQLERTQEELEDAREALDNSRKAVATENSTQATENSEQAAENLEQAAENSEQAAENSEQAAENSKDTPVDPTDQLATIKFLGDQLKDLKEEKESLQTEMQMAVAEMQMAVDNAGSARRQLDKIQQENEEFQEMLGTEVVVKFKDMKKKINLLQKENDAFVETEKEAKGKAAKGEELAEQVQYLEEKGLELRTRLNRKEDELEYANDRIAAFEKEKEDSKLPYDDRIARFEIEAIESKCKLQDAKSRVESLEEDLEIANTALTAEVELDMDTKTRIESLEEELEIANTALSAEVELDMDAKSRIESLEKDLEFANTALSAQVESDMDQGLTSAFTDKASNVSTLKLQLQAATSRIQELEQIANDVIQAQIETEVEIVPQPTQDGNEDNDSDEDIYIDNDNGGNPDENVVVASLKEQLLSSQRQTKQVKFELETAHKQLQNQKMDLLNQRGPAEAAVDSESRPPIKSFEQEEKGVRQQVDNTQPKLDTTEQDQVKFLQELVASLGKKLSETQEELTSTKSEMEQTQLGSYGVGMENVSAQIVSEDEVDEIDQSRSMPFPSSPQENEPNEKDEMDAARKELEETQDDLSLARRRLREAQEEIEQLKSLETKIAELQKESDWTEQKLRNELIEREHEAEEAKQEWGNAVKEIGILKKASDKAEPSAEILESLNFVEETLFFVRDELKKTQEELRLALKQLKEAEEDAEKVQPLEEELKTAKLGMEEVKSELEETYNRERGLEAVRSEEVENMKFVEETVATLTEQLKEAEAEAEDAKSLLNEANQELLRLKPFESQLADIELQQATSFDAMEQMRGKSANRKVVALRNELEELRNELEEAQDDAQDAQNKLDEAYFEIDHLKQELEQRFPAVDRETDVTEQMFQTQLFQTERDLDEVRHELREALTKIHVLGLQSEKVHSEAVDAQHKLNDDNDEDDINKLVVDVDIGDGSKDFDAIFEAEADGMATESDGASATTAEETGAEQETPKMAEHTPGQSEKDLRKAMIDAELTMIIEAAVESVLEEKFEPEALEALKKAAFKICYLKKYDDTINEKYIYFPSVGKTILNYSLIEEAEKYYLDEDDELPLEYRAALRSIVGESANNESDEGSPDYDYMQRLAMDVDIGEDNQGQELAADVGGLDKPDGANPDVSSLDSGEDDVLDECAPGEEDDEIASPRWPRGLGNIIQISTNDGSPAQGLGGFLMSDEEARQHELIQELKLLRLEEETVVSGAKDEEEENESQQELMDESQHESLHASFVEPNELGSSKALNLSHKLEYTQERFHTLKEEIKDLRHTVQILQQEKIYLSEELDLIKDRDETVAASQDVLEGRDSGPNLEATRETFGQLKEEEKELRLTIQGPESGNGTIHHGVEDERTARGIAEKETAQLKASLVTCRRNLNEANEYFSVLLDRNKHLQADKRRLILELASAEGTGAARSVPKKDNGLDSQYRSLDMEDVALDSTSPYGPGNDNKGDLKYAEKLAEESETSLTLHDDSLKQARRAFRAVRNERDGLRDKIQTLAAEKYQISQEHNTANQACQNSEKRVEELEAAIFTHRKNLDEAQSYFHELQEKNTGVQNAIQRVEVEKIKLAEETSATKKQCAVMEARRDQLEEYVSNIKRSQEDALQSFGRIRQQNDNLEEENERLVQERDDAKDALATMGKALTTYRHNLEEGHSCFESLRQGNEELKDKRDEAETRADLLTQTLSTIRNNLDEAYGAFRDIQNQNEDLRFKIQIFHEERQINEDAGDGKFPLLQLIATLKDEINSLKTDMAKGEMRERETQEAMTGHQTNLEESRALFGTLQGEIDELRTKNAALKEMDMENLQNQVQELRIQNQEFEETQNVLETELNSMETTNAWKLHTNEQMLNQKLDTAVREQRLLEERLYKIQVSYEELQKTASRLETEKTAVEKQKTSLQDTVGMQGHELLNIRKQLDGIEGIDESSKDRIEFLKEQLEEINSPYDDCDNEVENNFDGDNDTESDEYENESDGERGSAPDC